MSDFKDTLKRLREGRGVSANQAAKGCGIPQRTWAHWESGDSEPGLGQLSAVADYFNVSIDYLAGRTLRNGFAEYVLAELSASTELGGKSAVQLAANLEAATAEPPPAWAHESGATKHESSAGRGKGKGWRELRVSQDAENALLNLRLRMGEIVDDYFNQLVSKERED